MLSTQMMKLAERNQWKTNTDEQSIFGEFNGYLFTGLEGKGFKAFITPLAGISQEGLQSLFRFLNENSKALRLYNFEAEDNFLCVRQREGLIPLTAEKMEYLLAQISGLISLNEMPTDACVICGESCSRKGLYYGLYCHLHPECQDHELKDFTKLADSETEFEADDDQEDENKKADCENPDDGCDDIIIEDEDDCTDEADISSCGLVMQEVINDDREKN